MSGTMRLQAFLVVSILAFSGSLSTVAGAGDGDPPINVSVSGHTVTATTSKPWHMNPDYPWKLVVGGTKLDKTKFTIDGSSAKVDGAPSGQGTLKGCACTDPGPDTKGTCQPFERQVTIN
jgi:hypothetical protein